VDALEELSYDKQDIVSKIQNNQLSLEELDTDSKVLAKVPSAIVAALQKQYKDITSNGGITAEEFATKIQKLQAQPGITPIISNFLLILLDPVETFAGVSDN
jgi:hypothetical protein